MMMIKIKIISLLLFSKVFFVYHFFIYYHNDNDYVVKGYVV